MSAETIPAEVHATMLWALKRWRTSMQPDDLLRAMLEAPVVQGWLADRSTRPAEPAPEVEVASLADACKPWEFSTGPVPDYDSPLHQVFVAGVLYAEQLLANHLGVKRYEAGDGSEDFDNDATMSLVNILTEAGLWDKDEWRSTLEAERARAKAEADELRRERGPLEEANLRNFNQSQANAKRVVELEATVEKMQASASASVCRERQRAEHAIEQQLLNERRYQTAEIALSRALQDRDEAVREAQDD